MNMSRLAVVAAAAVLAACAPAVPEVSGIGGSDTPTSSPTVDPTGSSTDGTSESQPGMPVDLPDETVGGGTTTDKKQEITRPDLPVRITASNRESLTFPPTGKFSAQQTEDAFTFAAAYAANRYSSGVWVEEQRVVPEPLRYYAYTDYMTEQARAALSEILLYDTSREQNAARLTALVPVPPAIAGGTWLRPAVGDWVYGQPTFTSTDGALTVAFTMTGSAIYLDGAGRFHAVPVEDTVSYTLVLTDGLWMVDDWTSTVTYGTAATLDYEPTGRTVPVPLPE